MMSACVVFLTTGCGSNNSTDTGGPPGDAGLRATIDGQAWVSNFANATAGANGIFAISGSSLNASVTGMSLVLYYIDKPGTYPLGVGGSVKGGLGVLSGGGASWATPLSGSAGTVSITSVSATRITGTFAYTAPPQTGQSTAIRTVTNGQFDLPVTGPATLAVADNLGSSVVGTVGGNAFTAATIVQVTSPSSGTLTMGASNTTYSMNMVMSGYTGPATYTMGTGASRTFSVSTTVNGAPKMWGGTNGTTTGTIVITSATSTRIKGILSLSLLPAIVNPGTGTLALSGTFELGIQ